eukprot:m.65229 g.65229  ORF g.65229 m.65229 type:complete len:445 (-) comp23534_c0_seq1:43-1377(-)
MFQTACAWVWLLLRRKPKALVLFVIALVALFGPLYLLRHPATEVSVSTGVTDDRRAFQRVSELAFHHDFVHDIKAMCNKVLPQTPPTPKAHHDPVCPKCEPESIHVKDKASAGDTAAHVIDETLPIDRAETHRFDSSHPPRIYCNVPFHWIESKRQRHSEIMNTWGKRCDGINFFVDPVDETTAKSLPANVVIINMTRTAVWGDQKQKHIWEKMWRSWVWVHDNKLMEYDYFLKVDDDNYFFPQNVRKFIEKKQWSPVDAHYFGHKLYHRQVPIIAGAMVGFSRGTVAQMGHIYRAMPMGGVTDERGRCEDRMGATEELSTAICLHQNGVAAENTRDINGREPIMIFWPDAHLRRMERPARGSSEEGWFWKNKPDEVGDLDDCCSRFPFALHGIKSAGNLQGIEDWIYNGKDFKSAISYHNPTNDAKVQKFWDDVKANALKPYV